MTEAEFREWLVGEGGEAMWREVWGMTRLPDCRPERYGLSRGDIRQSAAVHALDAVRRSPAVLRDPAAVIDRAVRDAVNDMRRGSMSGSIPKVAYVDEVKGVAESDPDIEADAEEAVGELLERFGGVLVRRVLDRMSPKQAAALRIAHMGDDPADHPVEPGFVAGDHAGAARRRFRVLWERVG